MKKTMKIKKNKKMSQKRSTAKKVAIGAGVAVGVAAAGAGAYYLLGPKGKAHQKKVRVLTAKIKKEVANEIKKVKKVSTPLYHKAVDVISANYAKQYKLHEKDIKAFAKKLKAEWKAIKK